MNQGKRGSGSGGRLGRVHMHELHKSGVDGCGGDESEMGKSNTKVIKGHSEHPIWEREFGKFGRRNVWEQRFTCFHK